MSVRFGGRGDLSIYRICRKRATESVIAPISNLRMDTMDEAFFKRALRQGLNDVTVSRVTIKDKRPAVEKGENFLSDLWRFTLEYFCNERDEKWGNLTKKNIKLIVKREPTGGTNADSISNQNIFNTEIKVFTRILPEMERLFGERLSPKFYYSLQKPGVIVLEDLAVLGFKIKDRQLGLSMDHILMLLENIAKFHAGSVYHSEQNPVVVQSFTKGIMTKDTPDFFFRILEQTLQMICDRCRRWPDSKYSRIADKLVVIKNKFAGEVLKATDYDESEFRVLNHGDCWINNIMFREDAHGKPLEVVLVDYQMTVYSSPAIDLIHFFGVCPEVDLHTSENDYFVEKYLRALTKAMVILGCKTQPPTIEDLQKAMLKRRMWAILGLTLYPRMIADISEVESFDDLLETGVTNMNIFKNPTATTVLQKILPIMDERGYFD